MGLNDYQRYSLYNERTIIMKQPVYGFEENYRIDENGNLFSEKDNFTHLKAYSTNASSVQKRYRLLDGKYYDAKYLVYKTFFPEEQLDVNDERIIFIDGNTDNSKLNNLKILNQRDRKEIALFLSEKYQEKILPMEDYEKYYISENGNAYSCYNLKPKILKPYLGADGYLQVKIPNNYGIRTHIKLHRAVALAFVNNPNPDKYEVVHHKDENKLNNNFSNLEWTTLQQNTVYSSGKKCCMLDKDYCILSIHDTIADLAKNYKVDSSTASKQCRGLKNQFSNGQKARFFDTNKYNFISTKFD